MCLSLFVVHKIDDIYKLTGERRKFQFGVESIRLAKVCMSSVASARLASSFVVGGSRKLATSRIDEQDTRGG